MSVRGGWLLGLHDHDWLDKWCECPSKKCWNGVPCHNSLPVLSGHFEGALHHRYYSINVFLMYDVADIYKLADMKKRKYSTYEILSVLLDNQISWMITEKGHLVFQATLAWIQGWLFIASSTAIVTEVIIVKCLGFCVWSDGFCSWNGGFCGWSHTLVTPNHVYRTGSINNVQLLNIPMIKMISATGKHISVHPVLEVGVSGLELKHCDSEAVMAVTGTVTSVQAMILHTGK